MHHVRLVSASRASLVWRLTSPEVGSGLRFLNAPGEKRLQIILNESADYVD